MGEAEDSQDLSQDYHLIIIKCNMQNIIIIVVVIIILLLLLFE